MIYKMQVEKYSQLCMYPYFYFVLPSSFLMFHEYFFCHFLSKISFRQFLVIGLLMTSTFSFPLYCCVFPQAYPLLVLIQLPESIGLCLWPHLWSFCHYFFQYCFCPTLIFLYSCYSDDMNIESFVIVSWAIENLLFLSPHTLFYSQVHRGKGFQDWAANCNIVSHTGVTHNHSIISVSWKAVFNFDSTYFVIWCSVCLWVCVFLLYA